MANPVSGVSSAHQAVHVAQAYQANQTPKQNAPKAAATEDTVTISNAGKASSQAPPAGQTQAKGGDPDHDGK